MVKEACTAKQLGGGGALRERGHFLCCDPGQTPLCVSAWLKEREKVGVCVLSSIILDEGES